MKLPSVVSVGDVLFQLREGVKNPSVETSQFGLGQSVFARVKIVEVRELVTQRVAQHAVRFADFIYALFADDDVIAIILRSHPKPHDIRAISFHVSFGGLWLLVSALLLFAFGKLL